MPRLPLGRLIIALLLVPGVYLTLALCVALALGVAGAAVYGTYYIYAESSHVNGRLIIFAVAVALGGLVDVADL